MRERRKPTPEEVEARVVPEIVKTLYPILYPVEQQSVQIQQRHHQIVTEIAKLAWRAFTSPATGAFPECTRQGNFGT